MQPLIVTIYGTISPPWKSAIVCRTCAILQGPLKDRSGKDTFNWFPVRSIKDELEDLLAIAGVEELLEDQAERGQKPTDAPLAAGKKLFNHQSDGSEWLRWDLDDPTG